MLTRSPSAIGNAATAPAALKSALLSALASSALPKFQAARAAQRAGVRNARVLVLGDSTDWAYGANGSGSGNNLAANRWSTIMAGILGNCGTQSWFGSGNFGSNYYPAADTRITPGSFGMAGGSSNGPGGSPYLATAAATFAFAPTAPVDTVEVYYQTFSGAGTSTLNVDGGASLGTINHNQATGFRKQTFTFTLGTHTINCVWASGSATIYGMVAYNAAAKEVSVMNAGIVGAKIADLTLATSPWSVLNAIATLTPDLVVVNCCINDWSVPTDPTTYQTGLQTLITAIKAAGADVLIRTPNPSDVSVAPVATQQAFVGYLKGVAAANAVPVVDIFTQFTDYTTATGRGLTFDTKHPSATGYAIIGDQVARVLNAA